MPRIPQDVVKCVFFLYRNEADALAGTNPGGTGFLISVGSSVARHVLDSHYYAISNWHVVNGKGGYPVIRLNKLDGGTDVINFDCADWHFVPGGAKHGGDDVAIVPLQLNHRVHDATTFNTYFFADENKVVTHQIGIGDDVFMLGLFADHDSRTANIPKARFGHVSMMATERAPIRQENGTINGSIVVDMHSRTGFSGSPVFMYRTLGANLDDANSRNIRVTEPPLFMFLGIHWGQFPETFQTRRTKEPVNRDMELEGMSGMSCVIPAWRVKKLLDIPKIVRMREERERDQRDNPEATMGAQAARFATEYVESMKREKQRADGEK